jgi:hypothetical protein
MQECNMVYTAIPSFRDISIQFLLLYVFSKLRSEKPLAKKYSFTLKTDYYLPIRTPQSMLPSSMNSDSRLLTSFSRSTQTYFCSPGPLLVLVNCAWGQHLSWLLLGSSLSDQSHSGTNKSLITTFFHLFTSLLPPLCDETVGLRGI